MRDRRLVCTRAILEERPIKRRRFQPRGRDQLWAEIAFEAVVPDIEVDVVVGNQSQGFGFDLSGS